MLTLRGLFFKNREKQQVIHIVSRCVRLTLDVKIDPITLTRIAYIIHVV